MRKWTVVAGAALALLVLPLIALAIYSAVELGRFSRAEARRATIIYAGPQTLDVEMSVRAIDLPAILGRLRYVETRGMPTAPGEFHRGAGGWDLFLRGDGAHAHRVHLDVRGERIARVSRGGGDNGRVTLEPEILTGANERPGEDYRPVHLGDVPRALVDAVLAAEDHRFFAHGGLDVRGLVRAAWANLRAGRVTQGGSTITQQLVKNRLLSPQRTIARKVREAWLAALVDWRYPKPQILEAYLNEVYLGQRGALAVRGVGAGARDWFGKEVHQLTLGEAALLAGMIRAPNAYSPAVDPDRARARRDTVLARMRDLGMIDDARLAAARREPVHAPLTGAVGHSAAYFADYVRRALEERLGGDAIRGGRVYTSLDLTLQRFAESAVARGLDRLETRLPRLRRAGAGRLQAALVALDPATGEVRALVGGRDYAASQFDRATLAHRQPGSAFKPFVYLAALAPRPGYEPVTAATLVDDAPLSLTVNGETWSPRNYGDHYEGRVSVRRAIEHSLNAATVRIAQTVGLPAIVQSAHALGIASALEPVPAMALGAFEVTPLELASAYVPFANGGLRPSDGPAAIRSVLDADGDTVFTANEATTTVISPAEAYLVTSLLQGVIAEGTATPARALGLTNDIAGKTGTTNEGRDAWFVGYSSRLLALVWVGFDDARPHGLTGAEAALPIWMDFMKQALAAYPSTAFTVPAGIQFAEIDPTNGKVANRYCPVVTREIFIAGTMPGPCTDHGGPVDHFLDMWRRFREWLGR